MKAIVTGGAGFIGSHIAEKLSDSGYSLTIIDNMHSGDIHNLGRIKGKYELVKGDSYVIQNQEKADAVFHEGIYSSTPMYRKDPSLVGKAITDFIAVLEYCRKNDVKLVFASTSSIYNGYEPPHRETMTPKVKDFYTEARYPMERLADLYSQMYGLKYCALRYFSVYGDGEESKKTYANMVSQIIWKGILDKELIIYGDGSQRRDLVNVADVTEANIMAHNKDVTGVFNIGGGKSHTFNQIIELVGQKLGKDIKVKYTENPLKNYVEVVEADTEKMKKILGFTPVVSIDEGINRAIAYYRRLDSVPDIF